jgi:hypothetical protein
MGKANGRNYKILRIAILMKENTQMIRKMAMEFLYGKVAIFIREIMLMMKEMVMEK